MSRTICRLAISFVTVFLIVGLATAQEDQVKRAPIQSSNPSSGARCTSNTAQPATEKMEREDGPAASELKTAPADLTTLAKRNGGTFPTEHVMAVLRNGVKAPAHGTSDMPTWGPLFQTVSSHDQAIVNMRISNLTNYLKSLQDK